MEFPAVIMQGNARYAMSYALGIAIHAGVFCRGEWDLYTTKLLTGAALLQLVVAYGFLQYDPGETPTLMKAYLQSALICLSTFMGILSSMVAYRAFFHRLTRFPGPFLARLSNFYVTSLSVKKFHLYEEVQQLHSKYGDIVRLGPSELSICDPKAVNLIYSNTSPCTKGPWYNIMYPVLSLHMIRDRKLHSQRRKTWDKGFSSKALRDYEPRVAQYTQQLLKKLDQMDGLPLDASTWFNFYSFDVMGDLAFGKSFNMLKDGIKHYYMETVHANMLAVSAFSHLVWIFPLFKEIPGLNYEHLKLQNWISSKVKERVKNKPNLPDVFSWILGDYDKLENPTKQDTINLHGDAHLIVVAGSDTTAASLTCLFFELAINPEICYKLQQEIDEYLKESNSTVDYLGLSKLKYLQACIDESLRLHPPIPSGLQRMTPSEGLNIGDTFIPGNTIVQVPSYTLNRDERLYDRPNEFIPERWTTKTELTIEASTLNPFSFGRYSCVGKQLGLMELRYVTSHILSRYNVSLAPGCTKDSFLGGLKDGFTLASPGLNLIFSRRTDI